MKAACSRVSSVALAIALVLGVGIIWSLVRGSQPSYAVTWAASAAMQNRQATRSLATSTTKTVVGPLSGERILRSNVAAADFDGDGDKELVVGGQDGMLYVIAHNGSSWSVVWSRQTAQDLVAAGAPTTSCATSSKSDIESSPAIGDLDNDDHLEIVVTTGGDPAQHRNGGVLVYRYDSGWSFAVVPGWPQPKLDIVGLGAGASNPDGCWDGIWGSPVLGDVDGDGDSEIAVEGFDRRLHLWHHDGTYVTNWPIQPPTITRGGWSTPAMADIDRDGLPEVVFGTDYENSGAYHLYAFNSDASLVPGFPVHAPQDFQSSPAIGDINGDGWLDIVVGTGTAKSSGGNNVYAWDHNGNLLPGWPTTTGSNMPASPALGDLDGDGDLEVVIGCGTEIDASCNWLYAWHGDATPVDPPGPTVFPVWPPNNSWTGDTAQGLPFPPVLADYDGDGSVEILIVHRGSFGIATVNSDGQSANDPALKTNYALQSAPLVDDIDNDGKVEIAIGGVYQQNPNGNGAVYIWDGWNGAVNGALPWPMFHHDVQRTGRYGLLPELGFPTEIRMFHQQGSGNPETQYAWVRNEGEGSFNWRITNMPLALQVVPSSGVVTTAMSVQFVVNTTGLSSGWTLLGTVNITGTASGRSVLGSPITTAVYVYVGDVSRIYLPAVLRDD